MLMTGAAPHGRCSCPPMIFFSFFIFYFLLVSSVSGQSYPIIIIFWEKDFEV